MGREGTRGASARKKSPKKAQADDASKAAGSATVTVAASRQSNDTNEIAHDAPAAAKKSEQPQLHPLERVVEGMNRRSLLTGLYGPTGYRIRHVVRILTEPGNQ